MKIRAVSQVPLPCKCPWECPPSLHPFACPAPNPRATRKVGGTEGSAPPPLHVSTTLRAIMCAQPCMPLCVHYPCTPHHLGATCALSRMRDGVCRVASKWWGAQGSCMRDDVRGRAHTPFPARVMCEREAMQRERVAPIPLWETMGGEGCPHAPPCAPLPFAQARGRVPPTHPPLPWAALHLQTGRSSLAFQNAHGMPDLENQFS